MIRTICTDRRTNGLEILFCVVFLLLVQTTVASESAAMPKPAPEGVVLQNEVCRFTIGNDGKNRSLVNLADEQDHSLPGSPFMLAGQASKTLTSSKVECNGDVLTVSFADSPCIATAKVEIRPRYFTLTVMDITGGELDWLQFSNLGMKKSDHSGSLVNAAWNSQFAICVMACNAQVDCGSNGVLTARAYGKYGIKGAKAAIIGVPTGGPSPSDRLLDAIETVEIEQGLPHPTLNGVWIKRAPERFASYLMVAGVNQNNVDQVIDFARGGFGCIEIFWEKSTPTYAPNPQQFPDGVAGLKQVADKIHAAGLQLGMHVMQGMVGWGSKEDPYITPKADPRLLQDRHATLAAPIDDKSSEIRVREPVSDWPEQGDLHVDGEIIRYEQRTADGFAKCQRGLWGTTKVNHAEGTRIGHLVNCFPIWGYTVYSPDVESTMVDEICDRIAGVFNEVGTDMAYFDGGEEIAVQPPRWRNQGRTVLGVQSRLKKPIIVEGNDLYTHHSWHVISRGGPSFDPIYFGRRAYSLRFKAQNPINWADNLLTGDVGWFTAHTHSPTTDAVTPDEVELLCLKGLGGKAPFSFIVDANNLQANKRMPEIREIIRTCDELKRSNYFSEQACAELLKPMTEHVLDRAADGGWDLCPRQFGPPRVVDANNPVLCEWTSNNPYDAQSPWLRIRARTALAKFGAKGNLVLADPAGGIPFAADGSSAAELVQSLEASAEKTPDGGIAFSYSAENRGSARSNWCRATLNLPQTLDLTKHRRLGMWIRTQGESGILNVQLAATDARREHYVTISNRDWTYVVLDPPEDDRFFEYTWPYPFTDVMYTCMPVYQKVAKCHLYFNGLAPGAKVACQIGRIEALEETVLPLVSPTLETGGRKLVFPVSLNSDEYLEADWSGTVRHFDPNGKLLGNVTPEGSLRIETGNNRVKFSCTQSNEASPRAEVTISLRGQPLANARSTTR